MSQIALDGFDIVPVFDTDHGKGMSQIVQSSFRDPHFCNNGKEVLEYSEENDVLTHIDVKEYLER